MKFDVYCDESHPDLFASLHPPAQFLVIGSLWLPTDKREPFKQEIHELRNRHKVGGEFKWQKTSPSRLAFYSDLIDWFIDKKDALRFRCIAIDHSRVNIVHFHESDQELGFYKFYYQLLLHWLLDFNEYAVFCDLKTNRLPDRLHVLQRCLSRANLSSTVKSLQSVRSSESVLIQLADVLTGVASARMNGYNGSGTAKMAVIERLEKRMGRKIAATRKYEEKFNVFKIHLEGGW